MDSDTAPLLLTDHVARMGSRAHVAGSVIGYPRHWQVPAATEKSAYEALARRPGLPDFVYLGFPWATVIDGLRNDAAPTRELLRALDGIHGSLGAIQARRRVTVAQHIHADKFIELFRACGVTDLFWTHARADRPEIGGIAVHPFPLFPAQTPDGPEKGDLHRPRRYLANFIGAYNPKVYLTDVREHVFRDAGTAPDLLIIRREAWHFERAVYAEQMKGIAPDAARLALEAQHKEEYLQAMRDSTFTLCPSGSGPNSIRIGEALALGSIPIILTRDLALPGDLALWEGTCLIEEDSVTGYRQALARARAMPDAEVRQRQQATLDLFAMIGPGAYGELITARIANTMAANSRPVIGEQGQ
ncbi:MAG: exostosin family protein [Pseudorhodoplanes sp.]|uniref:exostosin domain-containing protein n=1 Tax=Pseudorhodoplanes sp. TaxID=1934341 RepID=UPI003D0D2DF9